jgi:putative transport protein
MHGFYRMNLLASMGALTATMTNPPGLGAANAQTDSDLPTLSYASVYPVALIFKILLAQLLVEILHRIL